MGDRRGLIVDWGGVLTTDVVAAFRDFCAAEGLEPDTVRDRFAGDPRGLELLAELECGRLAEAEFEAGFAALLGVSPAGLIDAWVISGEVGLRKPDPAIYPIAAERLGLPPGACVFVDDLPGNLKPARALGMATVVHRDAESALAELEDLLGVPLRRASRGRRGA